MGFVSSQENVEEYIEAFNKCAYKKILFYNDKIDVKGALKTERFVWFQQSLNRVDTHDYNDYVRWSYYEVIDVLKLLTDGVEYSREN